MKYAEIKNAKVNHIILVIKDSWVNRKAKNAGFHVVDYGSSNKRVPDGYPNNNGSQRYVTLLK